MIGALPTLARKSSMPFLLRCLLLLPLLVVAVAGCDRDRGLHGQWVFDRAYTESRLNQEKSAAPAKGILGEMKAGLVAMLVPTLIEKLDGSNLTITKKEMIITTKDGTGKAEGYVIVERPEANVWRVKKPDGTIETYTKEGDRLASATSGDVHFIAYFRRR